MVDGGFFHACCSHALVEVFDVFGFDLVELFAGDGGGVDPAGDVAAVGGEGLGADSLGCDGGEPGFCPVVEGLVAAVC